MCFPADKLVIKQVKAEVKRIGAKAVFVATDNDDMITAFSKQMKTILDNLKMYNQDVVKYSKVQHVYACKLSLQLPDEAKWISLADLFIGADSIKSVNSVTQLLTMALPDLKNVAPKIGEVVAVRLEQADANVPQAIRGRLVDVQDAWVMIQSLDFGFTKIVKDRLQAPPADGAAVELALSACAQLTKLSPSANHGQPCLHCQPAPELYTCMKLVSRNRAFEKEDDHEQAADNSPLLQDQYNSSDDEHIDLMERMTQMQAGEFGLGGSVYFGLTKDGQVQGIKLTRDERDEMRLGIDHLMTNCFVPPVFHNQLDIIYKPVFKRLENRQFATFVDLFVVEILIKASDSTIYNISKSGHCWHRFGPHTTKLSVQDVRQLITLDEEAKYKDEIRCLREELRNLKLKAK
nr:hypothetical protein BaRGS_032368 [Batillaria attramentaria]